MSPADPRDAGPPSVLALILNYRRPADTIECVRSLQECGYPALDVLVIDNGSADGSEETIRRALPGIGLLQTGENLGYTGGINAGLKRGREIDPDYLFVLNNDTVVEKGFLSPLVGAMEERPDAAAACGAIYEYHDRGVLWYGGGRMIPWRGLAVHELKGMRRAPADLGPVREVSFLTGCMWLLRTEIPGEIGDLDDRFFMYLDDIEYSARISSKGYAMLLVPSSVIYHKVLGETESAFKLYYSMRNRLLLIRVSLRGASRFFATVYFLTVAALKTAVWTMTRPRFATAARAGLGDAFSGKYHRGNGFRFYHEGGSDG